MLLQSSEVDIGVLKLSIEVNSALFPVVLVIQSEPRDKHGNRPSTDMVLLRGIRFMISSSGVTEITVSRLFFNFFIIFYEYMNDNE